MEMNHSLTELQHLMVRQLRERGYYPRDEMEVLLRLGEEVGEVMEAVRERQPTENLGFEMVDVLWNLLRLAELKGIDLEAAFIRKLHINQSRPMETQNSRPV